MKISYYKQHFLNNNKDVTPKCDTQFTKYRLNPNMTQLIKSDYCLDKIFKMPAILEFNKIESYYILYYFNQNYRLQKTTIDLYKLLNYLCKYRTICEIKKKLYLITEEESKIKSLLDFLDNSNLVQKIK